MKHFPIKFLIKFALIVALLWILADRGLLSVEQTRYALSRFENVIPAFLALFACNVLSIWRWKSLLHAQGLELKPLRVLELGFVGNFFNIALPGAVSGDIIKAIYVARDVPGNRARALGSILFDRAIGVSGIVCMSAGALIVDFFTFGNAGIFPKSVVGAVAFAAVVNAFALIYLFLVQENMDPVLRLLSRISSRFPRLSGLERTYLGLRAYHSARASVLNALFQSIVIQSLSVFAGWQLAIALGEAHLSFLHLATLIPIGMLFTAIPVLPAGIGTGHVAFAFLFHLLGSDRGADLFTLMTVYRIFAEGGLGGLVYLRFRSSAQISHESNG